MMRFLYGDMQVLDEFVLDSVSGVVFDSFTGTAYLAVQHDGNLVIYDINLNPGRP
jgi:hypothetical protein